jgi:hypothetical protein
VKFVLHVIALILIMVEINLIYVQFTPYTRACLDTFQTLFASESRHYAIDTAVGTMRSAAVQYFDFPARSINRWQFLTANNATAPLSVTISRDLVVSYNTATQTYNFTRPIIVQEQYWVYNRTVFPPFDHMSGQILAEYIFTVESVQFDFAYVNIAEGPLGTMPVMWNVSIFYDYTGDGGVMHSTVDIRETVLGANALPPNTVLRTLEPFVWLNCTIMLVALASLALNIVELRRGYRLYKRTKQEFPKGVMLSQFEGASPESSRYTSWTDVPFDVKLQFFNMWAVVVVVGSLSLLTSTVFGVVTSLGDGGSNNDMFHVFVGVGGFFYSLAVIRYLEFSSNLLALTLTVKLALSRVFYVFVSVMPIFIGYLLLGVVMFSRYTVRFANLGDAAVSLFSLINGDDIHSTFEELEASFPYNWVARIYMFSFVAFFISTVLNTIIFIIEDAFLTAKRWVWTTVDRSQQRRPFDICLLFDIIEARQAASRRNLSSYFRRRMHGTAPPGSPGAAAAAVAGGPASQTVRLAGSTGMRLMVPSGDDNEPPSLGASSDDALLASSADEAPGSPLPPADELAVAGAAATRALEERLARMEQQQSELLGVIRSLQSQLRHP